MKGYKGFEPGLICKGKQYAENTVFEEPKAKIREAGMHFCENPFDVLDYYSIVNQNAEFNDFAEVEAVGDVKTKDRKKFCTTKLKIGAKLSFAGFVKACVDFVIEKSKIEENKLNGNYAKIGSSGNYAKIGSSGDDAQIGSSGHYAKIGSSGNYAKIGSSGNYAKIGSSGNCAQIGSSGDDAKIGSSGHCAKIGSSGNYAKIGSSGDDAQIGSSGNYARINCEGKHSVVCCAGMGSVVKAKKGCWITLSEWEYSDEEKTHIPVCVKTEFVDGERIKENTFYKLQKGEFVEVMENAVD